MPMYQFPCSLVALFPESVYKNAGVADVLPLVMQSLDPDKVQCVQFLRAGRVRLTFDDPESCAAVLKSGLDLGDVAVQLFPADERVRLVHLRDLPIEVGHDAVSSFFSTYGEVLSVEYCHFDEFPSVRNGNRLIKILLTQDIPYFIEIESQNCRVWYRRQPSQCSICHEFGHRARACPLSGRCRRCRQPGHVARECTQAWGPPPSVDVDDSSTSDPTTVPDSDKTSDPEPSPDPVPVPDPRADLAAVSVNLPDPEPADRPPDPNPVSPKPDPIPDKPPIVDPVVTDVPMPAPTKPSRSAVSGPVFCARLSKIFSPREFPEINASGKQKESKTKSYIRNQISLAMGHPGLAASYIDYKLWSDNDLRLVSAGFCEMLSIRQPHLVDFVFGVVKSFRTVAMGMRS